MAKQTVNIELRGSGGSQVVQEFGKASKASQDFIVNVKKRGKKDRRGFSKETVFRAGARVRTALDAAMLLSLLGD